MVDVWQYYEYVLDSEYASVLNMPGLHMVLKKILQNRYLTRFWYASSSEYASVTQASQYDRAWIYKGSKYVKVKQGSV